MPRSTGGTPTRRRPTPRCAGSSPTRRPSFRTTGWFQENARRGRLDPEFELLDTGAFDDDRYWDIGSDYAKAAPDDVCILVTVRNAGPDAATLDVLPTLWFRNTWSWELGGVRPEIVGKPGRLEATHASLGKMTLVGGPGGGATTARPARARTRPPRSSVTTRRTRGGSGDGRASATRRTGSGTTWSTARDRSTPTAAGTKGALYYRLTVPAGETARSALRLSDGATDLGAGGESTP